MTEASVLECFLKRGKHGHLNHFPMLAEVPLCWCMCVCAYVHAFNWARLSRDMGHSYSSGLGFWKTSMIACLESLFSTVSLGPDSKVLARLPPITRVS